MKRLVNSFLTVLITLGAVGAVRLPELTPLDSAVVHRWSIPAELEPDAEMLFYYGYKGDSIPPEGFPLFIYLHGSGPRNYEWETGLRIARQFDDAPAAYFIPRIPNEGDYYRWWQRGKQYLIEELLRQALVSGKIDPARVYIFGISEGGYGSQRLASYYADYLAGAGPMAGGEPLRNAPAENCRNIAFSMLTGGEDTGFYRNRLTAEIKQTFDSLHRDVPGAYVNRVELIPGMGHKIDYSLTTPWLKQYRRSPSPTRVVWENFELDGRKRNAFANLRVRETCDSLRTRYDMRISDNIVELDVRRVIYEVIERDPQWGIELKSHKTYNPAESGEVEVFLDSLMVDFSRPIEIWVNGRLCFKGRVTPSETVAKRAFDLFGDPMRRYPAAVTVRWER